MNVQHNQGKSPGMFNWVAFINYDWRGIIALQVNSSLAAAIPIVRESEAVPCSVRYYKTIRVVAGGAELRPHFILTAVELLWSLVASIDLFHEEVKHVYLLDQLCLRSCEFFSGTCDQ